MFSDRSVLCDLAHPSGTLVDSTLEIRLPGLTTAEAIHGACRELIEAGWLGEPLAGTGFQHRGRAAYRVSPRLAEALR